MLLFKLLENRERAVDLLLCGLVYTEDYITQHLVPIQNLLHENDRIKFWLRFIKWF